MVRVKHHSLKSATNANVQSFTTDQFVKGKLYMHRSKTMWIARKYSSKFPNHFTFYNLVKSKKFAIPVKDIIANIPNEDVFVPYFQQRKQLMSESDEETNVELVQLHYQSNGQTYSGEAQIMKWEAEYMLVDLFDQRLIHYGYGECIKGQTGVKVNYQDVKGIESVAGIEKWITDAPRQCDCPECEHMDYLENYAQQERELEQALQEEWLLIEHERQQAPAVRRSERIRSRPAVNYNY